MRQAQAAAFAVLAAISPWLPGAVIGADRTHRCASIASDVERLACYDAAFGRSSSAPERAGGETNAAPAATSMPNASRTPGVVASTATASGVASPTSADNASARAREDFGLSEVDKRARKPSVEPELATITSTLSKISSRPTGELVLTLGDGQVWTQVQTDTRFRAREGDTVTIRKASLGSFMMVGPDRIATRVRRVK
jgi:hypothetical protein